MKGLNFYTYQWPEDSREWRLIIRKGDEAVELLPDELDKLISVIVNFKKRQEEKAPKIGIMNVEQIKIKKLKLETEISKLVDNFLKETKVSLDPVIYMRMEKDEVKAAIKVILN